MRRRCLTFGALVLAAVLGLRHASTGAAPEPAAPAKTPPAADFAKDIVPFLAKNCYACHGNGKKRGGLSLDQYRDADALLKDRRVWEGVVDMVRSGEMPPKERPRPTPDEIAAAVGAIDSLLAVDCTGRPNAGRVTLRRLNKVEYNNTIRDLVGIDFKPAADFPDDDVGYGFDNIGDVLSVSPLLLEKYLAAAESILDRAIVVIDAPKPKKERLGGLRIFPEGAGELRRFGAATLNSRGGISGESYFEEGDYTIRAEVYGKQGGDQPVRAALRVNREDAKEFEVKATEKEPATLELKVRLKAGTARVAVSFVNPTDAKAEADQRRQLFVRSIEVDGPYNAPAVALPEAHKRLMAHAPDLPPREAAREIVTRFASGAYRRPVRPDEVEGVLTLYDKAEKAGDRFEARVRLALYRVLVSPHFLFRVELDPPGATPGTPYPIDEYALASRLSYFLWSTMPDQELRALAAQRQLRRNLDAQVRRMVKDPKSMAFVQSFAGQWLTLRKLDTIAPDPKTFPNFDADLKAAMVRETELFFEAVLREDRSVLDLIDSDFSFVNERLAKHYGIAGVKGKEFVRVKLPANRGGVLTQASVLTLTSSPTRTSPVKRGKWVLDQILNTPPPPPPDDVPELNEEKRLTGSLRQVMEQHRANALCASCHAKMDPIGFGFENFDAVGAWRDRDGGFPVDSSGVLPDGKAFNGPGELKAILRGKRELFGRSLAEKVLTYALGRGLEHYDRCAVDKIVAALDKNDYRFSALLTAVVQSEPFQMRTASGGKP